MKRTFLEIVIFEQIKILKFVYPVAGGLQKSYGFNNCQFLVSLLTGSPQLFEELSINSSIFSNLIRFL